MVRSARGGAVAHHRTYELALADGRILRTRVSLPPDRTDYGAALFSHVLRDQLCVDVDEFWACVRDGVLPARGGARSMQALGSDAVPVALVWQLVRRYGMDEAEVARMTKAEVLAALERFWGAG